MTIDTFGWQEYLRKAGDGIAAEKYDTSRLARVSVEHKNEYTLLTEQGEVSGVLRGNALKTADGSLRPKVGDWVETEPIDGETKAVIVSVLPRVSKLSRKAVMRETEQIMAANVDLACIVQGADGRFNVRALERYAVTARQNGVSPLVIINKAELSPNIESHIAEAAAVVGKNEIVATSTITGTGLDAVRKRIVPGTTVAFIGPSGVGKSSLVNALLGITLQETGEVRASDSKGRHTTTRRELIIAPSGAILIDSPGIRELAVWADPRAVDTAFEDCDALSLECEYRNCSHKDNRGCALMAAVSAGTLSRDRYENYVTLKAEASPYETKGTPLSYMEKKRKRKQEANEYKRTVRRT